ncbi:MAG: TolC family protein [Firmicutes bacterium]|nr:TolC family protein [Bacillota bacterium]
MLFFPPPVVADAPPVPQAPMAMSLPDALSRAKADNAMLRAAKARVDERRGLITTVRADALPQVTLIGDFTRVRDVSMLNGNMTGLFNLFNAFETKPGVVLPPFNVSNLVTPITLYTTQATVAQPLFYWGKIGTAIEIAGMGEKEAAFAYTTAELDVLHGVAKAYLAVLASQAELDVVEARKKTAEQFLSDVKAKLEAQSATELDRLRAESEYLAVVPESLQAEANYKRALEVLNGQLGLDPRTPLKLEDIGLPPSGETHAPGERSELAQLKQQETMLKANDRVLKSDLRPKFDLSASYGYQTNKTQNLFKEPYDAWKVSVTMRFPVFDGLRSSGRRAQNAAQAEQVRQLRLDKERAIAVEKSTAARELEKATAFHQAATKAHDAGLEALRMSRESYEQGLITSLDLLQAERTERLLESQRRRAELGLWAARFDQRRALGLPPL